MKTSKDRRSWFNMPRVPTFMPTSWWRNSVPPTEQEENRDRSPGRSDHLHLEISSPIMIGTVDTARKSPARDESVEESPEYVNALSTPFPIQEETPQQDNDPISSNNELPIKECQVAATKKEPTPPRNTEQRLADLLNGIPNISFSFFTDNDRISPSDLIPAKCNSLDPTADEQLACTPRRHGEPVQEEARTPDDCVESAKQVIKLENRSERCDGSSSENIKALLRSSSSDGRPVDVVDQGRRKSIETKTFESEYSIFIGKSVEINKANILKKRNSLTTSSSEGESPYASPRNSALSVSAVDVSTVSDAQSETTVPRCSSTDRAKPTNPSQEKEDFPEKIKPKLAKISRNRSEVSPTKLITSGASLSLSKDTSQVATSKSTKSLTEFSDKPKAISLKSSSQNAIYNNSQSADSIPPKLTIRSESIKLSEKLGNLPRNSSENLIKSASTNVLKVNSSHHHHHDRPPEPPPLPPTDWSDSLTDDYSLYELSALDTTIVSSPSTAPEEDINYEDVEELEYCQQRARSQRVTLIKLRRNPVVRVRSRLGKVARAVSGWWSEERVKLNDVIQKHAHAQAVGAIDVEKAMSEKEVGSVECLDERLGESGGEGNEEKGDDDGGSEGKSMSSVGVKRRVPRRGSRPTSRGVLSRSRHYPEGQNGFEELRRFIKQGGDFCKDLSAILQERSEAESQYAKSLSKLSGKLLKASKDSVGTVNQAWQQAGTQMEAQSEIHRAFAAALSEDVVKPLRQMVESQHRIRKSVESAVDKTGKSLSEWRAAEQKTKKQSFGSARENEKLQDAMLDVRLGRMGSTHALHQQNHKAVSDKESAKAESKRRKAEDAVKKADVEYYTFCIRAERARLEWETAVIRGSHCFQALEEERLQNLKDIASCYLQHMQEMGPKMVEITEQLSEPVQSCDVSRDIQTVVSIKGTGQPIPEQLLPDFYAEHITLAMNRDRRRTALVKILQLVRQDLDRERRGKQGVENLARALQETPTFGTEDSQQNVTEKLHHMRSMLTYLEAARYKVQSALAELDGRARGSHPLAAHIQVTRDRQGLQQSVLKVPPWVRKESIDRMAGDSPDWTDRGAADGNSVQPDSDFDEFSSQGSSEKDYQSSIMTYPVISECSESTNSCGMGGQCKALYEYTANLYDELNLTPGDIINIHDKQPDGWWLGELNGVVGIFPATYVEEIK